MMKKFFFSIFIFFFMITISLADTGKLKSSSIVTCNNIQYGYHTADNHWHIASKNSDGSYNATGKVLGYTNPCLDKVSNSSSSDELSSSNEKIIVTLSSCIDGDTAKFIADNVIKSVRFLSIDTPESTIKKDEYGKLASDFTCNKLTKAKKIELEYDNNSELYDKYGRLLAWIWVDDYLLQDEIIKAGLGEVAYVYGKYKYTPLLQDHQAIAQAGYLNIWSKADSVSSSQNTSSLSQEEFNQKKSIDLSKDLLFMIIAIIIILSSKRKKVKL